MLSDNPGERRKLKGHWQRRRRHRQEWDVEQEQCLLAQPKPATPPYLPPDPNSDPGRIGSAVSQRAERQCRLQQQCALSVGERQRTPATPPSSRFQDLAEEAWAVVAARHGGVGRHLPASRTGDSVTPWPPCSYSVVSIIIL